ncbi:phage tail protein [Pontibacillus salicampi]|uniref:Phage tail protein n=1 Tax=Pontibacillus salicampi TaxID=1449801 RepID=A0ABV6LTN4_9BACI
MATAVETFDAVSVKNTSIQFIDSDGTQQDGSPIGCVGTIGGETELKEIVKRCEGVEKKKKTKPIKMNLTLSAHVKQSVLRGIFGLSNQGMKPGIYKYSEDADAKDFILTADVIDEFEDVTKLIAFGNCTSATGLKFTVENGADELALMELEFTAYTDDKGNFMYEALIPELDDDTIKDTWHTQFNTSLVEVATP